MTTYAKKTQVSVDRSIQEIRKTLQRYGASAFRQSDYWANNTVVFEFAAHGRLIRIDLPLPAMSDFTKTPQGRPRSLAASKTAWDSACRQRFRALLLVIKAKLEAVESNISEFETEFMAFIVDPRTQRTVRDTLAPQLEAAYAGGNEHPLLLPAE